jgi:hypothetical protein
LGLFVWAVALPFNQTLSFWQYILSNTPQIFGTHLRRFTCYLSIFEDYAEKSFLKQHMLRKAISEKWCKTPQMYAEYLETVMIKRSWK